MNPHNIRIVLVETSHPGNIGAAARAMKNMGLDQLALVRPHTFPSAEATARASGADDLLAGARVFERIEDAVADCVLVFGASARSRRVVWPDAEPRAAAGLMADAAEAGQVAVLFGRERAGLTNAELDRCHYLLNIPANPDYPSLNIAAAVQIVAYELRRCMEQPRAIGGGFRPEGEVATGADLEGLYGHLEQALAEIGFFGAAQPEHLMRKLRRLFNRAQLDRDEINILRGILSAATAPRRRG